MTWFQYSSRRFRLAVTWPWSGRHHTSLGETALSRSLKSVTYWSCSPWISSKGRGAILPTQRTGSKRYRLTPKRSEVSAITSQTRAGASQPGTPRSRHQPSKAERSRTLDLVYSIFPRLAERKKQLAGTMSGGEQQMLAVGRGLMLKPKLLMLDEPSLGLAPVMTDVTFEKIGEIHRMGTAILLVEQNVSRALSLVQRAYVLESGKVIMHGSSAELANNKQVQAAYLGI